MSRTFLRIAAVSGLLAVVLGAFGAHFLKARLTPDDLQIFETGVRYQFYHTFALLAVALLSSHFSIKNLATAGWLFIGGIVLFSGSLYLLAFTHQPGMETFRKIVGPLTPLGGVLFIGGWSWLLRAAFAGKP